MWLYSSPLEALVVVVITGTETDRTVISYININSLIIYNRKFECLYPQKYSEWQPIILHAFTLPHKVNFGTILEMVTWELLKKIA